MKKAVLFAIVLCLCFAVFGASFAETAAEMTPEELYRAASAALDAKDYATAMKYYQLAGEAGNADGWRGLGTMYVNGNGMEPDPAA